LTGSLDAVAAAVRPVDHHYPHTGLICIENTQNRCGGVPLDRQYMAALGALAHAHGLPLHLDGARIFNAATATNTPVSRIARNLDSVMFCLSKGLGAPVGSMLVGDHEVMEQGRLYRKRLGGGMRQAGVLAAAGLIALEESPARLKQDHQNARLLC